MESIEQQGKYIQAAEAKGLGSRLLAYSKLSGPGWLQSAITLGGGSLASSLFLGVLAGYSLLWLQPVAILLGIIMLSSVTHVTLSTGQSPFVSINNEINPVLGWGWAIATIMANIVWCLRIISCDSFNDRFILLLLSQLQLIKANTLIH